MCSSVRIPASDQCQVGAAVDPRVATPIGAAAGTSAPPTFAHATFHSHSRGSRSQVPIGAPTRRVPCSIMANPHAKEADLLSAVVEGVLVRLMYP